MSISCGWWRRQPPRSCDQTSGRPFGRWPTSIWADAAQFTRGGRCAPRPTMCGRREPSLRSWALPIGSTTRPGEPMGSGTNTPAERPLRLPIGLLHDFLMRNQASI